jgi:hypothetical protein
MSMINDALKRAKDAQQKTPGAAPGPELQPLAPLSPSPRGIGMILPMFVILFVFMSFLFVWQTRQQVSATEPKAKSQSAAPANPAPKPVTIVMAAPKPPVALKPVVAATNAPVIAPEPAPKLQAIFFAPGHSTAILGGKTVRPGDVIKNFRIAAITQSSVTLFSRTQTNVLVLKQ